VPEWVRWVLAALACYRLAQFITKDDGPWHIFRSIRLWAGVYDLDARGKPKLQTGVLFGCPYCLAVWIAPACVALALYPTWPGDLFIAWIGFAGLQDALQGPRH